VWCKVCEYAVRLCTALKQQLVGRLAFTGISNTDWLYRVYILTAMI